MPNANLIEYYKTIFHEVAHLIDSPNIFQLYKISNSDEWKEKVKLDEKNINYYGFDAPFGKYSSKYSMHSAFKHKGNRKYSEDYAESVALYLMGDPWFKRAFRHKYEFLRELFKR